MSTRNYFIAYLFETKDFQFFLMLNAQCGFGFIFSDTQITIPFHAVIAIIYLDWGFPNKRLIISFVRDALKNNCSHVAWGGNAVFQPLRYLNGRIHTLKKLKYTTDRHNAILCCFVIQKLKQAVRCSQVLLTHTKV